MKLRTVCAILLLIAGGVQTAESMYIPAKAWLAQKLIHRAWLASGSDLTSNKPWPWADMTPVARLVVPDHAQDLIVLSGASGEALAFGPGHVAGSDAPGGDGHVVIGGHRDTHFRFLKRAARGQVLQLQGTNGEVHRYRIESIDIADITRQPLVLAEKESLLTLITCYPFDSLSANGNKRFVVTARRV